MQNAYKTQEGQTLFDIAMHQYGSIEGAFELADRLGTSLTNRLNAGTSIDLPKQMPPQMVNRYVAVAIQNRNIVPRTAAEAFDEQGGIGYAQVWVSFKVS